MRPLLLSLALSLALPMTVLADGTPPPLPEGLEDEPKQEKKEEPALPPGLFGGDTSPPSLPPGLGGDTEEKKDKDTSDTAWGTGLGIDFSGFTELRLGIRTQGDANQKAVSIGEFRTQLSAQKAFSLGTATLTADLLLDPVLDQYDINLEGGAGWLDLREAHILMRPFDFADVKLGRQVLTWGTGDLLFINDLFPKDWNAFFIGRDEEYLKAPSDALKLALFADIANLDIIYTPRFDADRFIDGKRLSYFHPGYGTTVGQNAVVNADKPSSWFSDDEWSLRLYRNLGATEAAFYFYDGFHKSPSGQNPNTGMATFPRLRVYGASVRRPMMGGVANIEVGLYDSLDDSAGTNPFVPNSEFRFLAGFEKELAPELTGAFQYYLEQMRDHDAYVANQPVGMPLRDRSRHVLTARLTKLARNQTLTWSLFAYYSPSDNDGYARPKVSYKLTDAWLLEGGANIFFGKRNHTFFGQFKSNSNMFAGVRYSF